MAKSNLDILKEARDVIEKFENFPGLKKSFLQERAVIQEKNSFLEQKIAESKVAGLLLIKLRKDSQEKPLTLEQKKEGAAATAEYQKLQSEIAGLKTEIKTLREASVVKAKEVETSQNVCSTAFVKIKDSIWDLKLNNADNDLWVDLQTWLINNNPREELERIDMAHVKSTPGANRKIFIDSHGNLITSSHNSFVGNLFSYNPENQTLIVEGGRIEIIGGIEVNIGNIGVVFKSPISIRGAAGGKLFLNNCQVSKIKGNCFVTLVGEDVHERVTLKGNAIEIAPYEDPLAPAALVAPAQEVQAEKSTSAAAAKPESSNIQKAEEASLLSHANQKLQRYLDLKEKSDAQATASAAAAGAKDNIASEANAALQELKGIREAHKIEPAFKGFIEALDSVIGVSSHVQQDVEHTVDSHQGFDSADNRQ